ncbi:MAG: hypothetical protein WCL14_11900 [Bacteroidota bacterium]
MKSIDQETIDFAEDFFFKLSDMQLKERMEDLKRSQKMVHLQLMDTGKKLHYGDARELFWKYCLMVDYCFKNTYGELQMISSEAISKFFAWRDRIQFEYVIGDGYIDFEKYYLASGQSEFLAYLHNKIFASVMENGDGAKENDTKIMLGIMTMVFFYQNEIKRME